MDRRWEESFSKREQRVPKPRNVRDHAGFEELESVQYTCKDESKEARVLRNRK